MPRYQRSQFIFGNEIPEVTNLVFLFVVIPSYPINIICLSVLTNYICYLTMLIFCCHFFRGISLRDGVDICTIIK